MSRLQHLKEVGAVITTPDTLELRVLMTEAGFIVIGQVGGSIIWGGLDAGSD